MGEYENEVFPHQNVKYQGNWKTTVVWYEGMQAFAMLDEQKVEVFPYVEDEDERILCWIDRKVETITVEGDWHLTDY